MDTNAYEWLKIGNQRNYSSSDILYVRQGHLATFWKRKRTISRVSYSSFALFGPVVLEKLIQM
jgi:hypothetical protein